ncbi:MAG TPA: SPOR domain-containing protein [Trinickia sp.]|uniref:SPOR domain-containing protein n=1 Tax=Trinickia sp. TaxID=2571163 RepID=UPI002C0153A6|nr:SPOR domain-containing protein [Trinickia sp.]HTI17043.1 SPOR domain-containing protein [Trinickia sp.]
MAQPSRRNSPRSASQPNQSKQTGGTFLGIVLGLIVGLAIAVVVALYITRAPTPFVEKVPAPAASSTGTVDQQFDPNRALQGKSPGQPVPQTAQNTPPNTAPGQSAAPATNPNPPSGMLQEPQIVEVPPSAGSTPPPNGTAPDQQAEQAEPQVRAPVQAHNGNDSANKPPVLANVPPPGSVSAPHANNTPSTAPSNGANLHEEAGYFLQVGSYRTAADAEQQRARLAFQGFESRVTQRAAGGSTYYRVRIGPFPKFEEMNTIRQRLSEAGIDTAVIPPKQ